MSTNYAISSFIHLDELKALTKIRSLGDTDSINGIVEVKIIIKTIKFFALR